MGWPNVKIFETGGHFVSIPVTHKIGAAKVIRISQNVFNVLEKVGGLTLGRDSHFR
jgi:hypothetical protein